jgi:hypothetical protein
MTMDMSFLLEPASVLTPESKVEVAFATDAGEVEIDAIPQLEVSPPDAEQLAREARQQLDRLDSKLLWLSVRWTNQWGISQRVEELEKLALSSNGRERRDFVASNGVERSALLSELADGPEERAEVAEFEAKIAGFRLSVDRMEAGVAASKADLAEAEARRARYAAQFGIGHE